MSQKESDFVKSAKRIDELLSNTARIAADNLRKFSKEVGFTNKIVERTFKKVAEIKMPGETELPGELIE